MGAAAKVKAILSRDAALDEFEEQMVTMIEAAEEDLKDDDDPAAAFAERVEGLDDEEDERAKRVALKLVDVVKQAVVRLDKNADEATGGRPEVDPDGDDTWWANAEDITKMCDAIHTLSEGLTEAARDKDTPDDTVRAIRLLFKIADINEMV